MAGNQGRPLSSPAPAQEPCPCPGGSSHGSFLPCQHTLKAAQSAKRFPKVKSAQALEGLELCPWREQSSSLGLRALQGHPWQGPFSALRLGAGRCPWAQSSLCKANVQAPRDIWKSQTASTHEKLKSDDGLKRPLARLRASFVGQSSLPRCTASGLAGQCCSAYGENTEALCCLLTASESP